ncbi:MAG: MoaD/ThiS family protein [Deltaproteobacteria bacterium]|nr:MoaD/ThiS family protein [Deltaproteobacteria bacterium]
MKITVRGYLTLKRAMGDEGLLEVEMESATPRRVLDALCRKLGSDFRDMIVDPAKGEVNPHMRILVNGRTMISLPDQLDHALHEGDELGLFPPLAGG